MRNTLFFNTWQVLKRNQLWMSELAVSTDAWLCRAVAWRNEKLASLTNIADQLNACQDLTVYLAHLKQFIQSSPSTGTVLQEVAVVGQLLGRLCSLPALLQNHAVCTNLLACLAGFCRHLSSLLEHKAKTWAVSQIRSIVGGNANQASSHLCGFQPQQFYAQCLKLMVERLQSAPPCDVAVVDICLHLAPCHHEFMQLLEQTMRGAQGADRDAIMTQISKAQSKPYTGEVSALSPGCMSALWLWDMRCVEHEILDLVTASVQEHHQHTLIERIKSRNLADVFCQFPQFWHAARSLLLTLWNKTSNDLVIRLCSRIVSLLPSNLQALHTPKRLQVLLGFSPNKLEVRSCSSHLLHLVSSQPAGDHSAASGGDGTTWLLLHPEWWTALTSLPLLTHSQVSSDCSKILCDLLGMSHHQQSCVAEFLDSLRGLLHKASVTIPDIQCALPEPMTPPRALVSHCFCVFLLLLPHDLSAETTHYILVEVCSLKSAAAQEKAICETKDLLLQHSPIQAVNLQQLHSRASSVREQIVQRPLQ